MPIYQYRCKACGFESEFLQRLADAPMKDCPECGKPELAKQLTAAGFQLKGSGWYATDFKGGPKPKSDRDSSGDNSGEAKGRDAQSGDSKSRDAQSGDSKSRDAKGGDSNNSDDAKTSGAKSNEGRVNGSKTGDSPSSRGGEKSSGESNSKDAKSEPAKTTGSSPTPSAAAPSSKDK
jgi:putative FmdB family regulatory protein